MDHGKKAVLHSKWTAPLELGLAFISLIATIFGIVWYAGASAEARWISPPLIWTGDTLGKSTDFWKDQGAQATLLIVGAGLVAAISFMKMIARYQAEEKLQTQQQIAEAQRQDLAASRTSRGAHHRRRTRRQQKKKAA